MENFLTLQEAANTLAVSKDSLRRWEREGKITSIRTVGKHRRYLLSTLKKELNII